jgi:iron complex transport system ATP-binding protein
MDALLSLQDVYFGYRDETVLRGLSFSVEEGEIFGVVGPNASGKTTMIRLMDGLLTPRRGSILLRGEDLRNLSRRKIASQVAVVPQEHHLLFPFKVMEVVLMGRFPHIPPLGFEGTRDHDVAMEALRKTRCHHLKDREINELSGGERQLVFIARALAQEPKLLLLDEPTVHLDFRHQLEFMDVIIALNRLEGVTVVWVSHDINLAAMSCDRILLLHGGRNFALGRPSEVLTPENLHALFGRRVRVDLNPHLGAPQVTPIIETPGREGSLGGGR